MQLGKIGAASHVRHQDTRVQEIYNQITRYIKIYNQTRKGWGPTFKQGTGLSRNPRIYLNQTRYNQNSKGIVLPVVVPILVLHSSAPLLHAPRSKLLAPSPLQEGKSTDVGSFPLRCLTSEEFVCAQGKEIIYGKQEKKLIRKGKYREKG